MAGERRTPGLPDPRVDVGGLRAFVAVARLGTVGRAAGALDRTQPSISSRLAGLERAWGTRLFRRTARGMTLTPEGARLLPRAESALRELEQLDRSAGVSVARQRELRVGAGDALGRRVLPAALARLLGEDPELEIALREGPRPGLIEALRNGEIDLALVVGATPGGREEGVDLAPLFGSEVLVLAPRGTLGSGRRALTIRSLAQRRLVSLQTGSGFRRLLEAAFEREGLVFRPAVEVGNLSLVRRFVDVGLGVAPVPAVAFDARDTRGIDTRRLAGLRVRYERAVRAGAPAAPAATRLLEILGEPI